MSSTYMPKRNRAYETLQSIKKNHLTIVFNSSASNIKIENYKAKMPTIALSHNLDIFDVTLSYKIPGNFRTKCDKKVKSHLFWALLRSFLRKFKRVAVPNKKRKRLRQHHRNIQNNKLKKNSSINALRKSK